MKERGLCFTSELVPKVLDGSKTVTRRLGGLNFINRASGYEWQVGGVDADGKWRFRTHGWASEYIKCPHGVPGDRFYLKETWALAETYDKYSPTDAGHYAKQLEGRSPEIWHQADCDGWPPPARVLAIESCGKGRSPRFMPKWAARRKRWELVSIRPERVQEITFEDVAKEGFETKGDFFECWDELNEKRGYPVARNPWTFRCEWNPEPVVKG